MLALQLVAHAWQYERCLTYFLSALHLHPPAQCRVTSSVFYCESDLPVVETLDYFRGLSSAPSVALDFRPLDQPRLCRRAIGRDLAALETAADYVLFCDVDYLFGPGALDAAAAAMPAACAAGPRLMYPGHVWSSIEHCDGDAELARVDRPQLIDVDRARYEHVRLPRSIGGCQYLPGPWIREHGYVRHHRRYQRPAENWSRTWEDAAFRRQCGLPLAALEIPNVFRLRHSRRGRTDIGCRN